jgi:hypothetical protein
MRGRHAAFAALAGIIALVAWTATTSDNGSDDVNSVVAKPPSKGPSPATDRPSQSVDDLTTSGPGSRENAVKLDGLPPTGFISRERPRALAVARRFLNGYFAYEARDDWPQGAREVAATATSDLASDLLAGGGTLTAVMDELPPAAEVYAIDLEFDKPPTTASIRAEVKRGSDRSDIAVIAKRKDTRWVITRITE